MFKDLRTEIELLWVPSHLENKNEDEISKKKTEQLKTLRTRFGEHGLAKLLALNNLADTNAKKGLSKIRRFISIPDGANPTAIILNGSYWEGNLRSLLKLQYLSKHKEKDEKMTEKGKSGVIDFEQSNLIFRSNKPNDFPMQSFIFKLRHGGLKSLTKQFEMSMKQHEESHWTAKAKTQYPSFICPNCEGKYGSTLHIICQCKETQTERTTLETEIEQILLKETKIINEETLNTAIIWKQYKDSIISEDIEIRAQSLLLERSHALKRKPTDALEKKTC